jgi:hypothetical protein
MMFYIGTMTEIPKISLNKNLPALNTKDISAKESEVRKHLSLPCVAYIGSDEGCGCGFRHALLQDRQWFPVVDEEDNDSQLKNQRQLFNFIVDNLKDQDFVEIYGCWDGDLSMNIEFQDEIELAEILETNFYFKERGQYKIRLK